MPSVPSAKTSVLAAVDLGSNSFHLALAQIQGSELRLRERLRETIRLVSGLTSEGRLNPEVRARALACLRRFGKLTRGLAPASVRAVGTSTLRRLDPADPFMAEAAMALGQRIEIISGQEEGRLTFRAVSRDLGQAGPVLVIDLGGGSTELVVGMPGEPQLARSCPMGCLLWTERFFPDGQLTGERFEAARMAARVLLRPCVRDLRAASWQRAIGASGAVRGIWRVMRAQGWADEAITAGALQRTVHLLLQTGHIDRIDFPDLREDRRQVFPGGLAIMVALFEALDLERLATSERALRDGVLLDLQGRDNGEDRRERSLQELSRRLGRATEVDRRVEERLWTWVEEAQAWPLQEHQWLLRQAWRLRQLGGAVAADHASAEHGAYLLRHADLDGFSLSEQERLAALVLLQGWRLRPGWAEAAPPADRILVHRLAALLRLAQLLQEEAQLEAKIDVDGDELCLHLQGRAREPAVLHAALDQEATELAKLGLRLRLVEGT